MIWYVINYAMSAFAFILIGVHLGYLLPPSDGWQPNWITVATLMFFALFFAIRVKDHSNG